MARRRSSYSQPGGHWSPPSLYELYHPAGFVQKADYGLYQFKTVFLQRYRDSTTRGAHSAPGFFSTEDAPPQIVCEQIELTAEKTFDFDISELPSLLKY